MHLNSRAQACPAAEKRQQSWIKMVAGVASFTPQESARQIRVPATATTARKSSLAIIIFMSNAFNTAHLTMRY
eukprot:scaffold348_cov329-Pavlova_lutheri.AAC.60